MAIKTLDTNLHQAVLLAARGNLHDAILLIPPGLSEEQKERIFSILKTAESNPGEAPSLERRIFIILEGNVGTQSIHESEQNPSTLPQTESQLLSLNRSGLLDFPRDVVDTILLCLRTEDFFGCQLVCKELNKITRNEDLCRTIYHRDFCMHYPRRNSLLGFYDACKDAYIARLNLLTGVYSQVPRGGFLGSVGAALTIFDGKLYAGFSDGEIEIQDLNTGFCIQTLKAHQGFVKSLAVFGRRLCSGSQDEIKIWDLDTKVCLKTFPGKRDSVILAIFDGKLCSGSPAGIEIWDIDTGDCLQNLLGHPGGVSSIAVFERKLCIGSHNGTIDIWDLGINVHCSHNSQAHQGTIGSLAAFNGKLYSCCYDGEIKVWDLETGSPLESLQGNHGGNNSPFTVFDGKLCVGTPDGTIKMWNLDTRTFLNTLQRPQNSPFFIGVKYLDVCGGRLCSVAWNTQIDVWDFQAKHTQIYAEIVHLLNDGEKSRLEIAMERFSRMPKAARNKIYHELYHILKPFSNDYFGCAEHAFHGQYGLSASPWQRAEAIQRYLESQGANQG